MHVPAELGSSPGWLGRSKELRCVGIGGAFSHLGGLRNTGIDTRTVKGELRVLRLRKRWHARGESGSRSKDLVDGDIRPVANPADSYSLPAGKSGLDLRPGSQTSDRPVGRSGGAGNSGGEAR
jgi:hypothetical protein